MPKQQLLDEFKTLSADEQVDLFYELVDFVAPSDEELSDDLKRELDRRRAEMKADPKAAIPVDAFLDELERQL